MLAESRTPARAKIQYRSRSYSEKQRAITIEKKRFGYKEAEGSACFTHARLMRTALVTWRVSPCGKTQSCGTCATKSNDGHTWH